MFFMAYIPQLTVSVETSYWSSNARLNEETGRRALRRRPCPATAGSRGPVPSLFTLHSQIAPSTWLAPLRAGMK